MADRKVYFEFRWICLVVILTLTCAGSVVAQKCGMFPTPGFTTPSGDINIEYGKPLEIFCTINDDKDNGTLTSDDLRFYRKDKVVHNEMVERVNSTTIRMYVEKPPLSKTVYYCKKNGSVVCLNQVAVGMKPQNVSNFSCIGYNYDNLTCSWLAPQNNVKTNYNLIYRFPGRNSRNIYKCYKINSPPENVGLMTCYWDITTDPPYRQMQQVYYFTLNISNIFGNFSKKFTFNHFERVIPNPPERLQVVNRTSESIFLNWTIPSSLTNFPPGLESRVVYQSEYDNDKEWIVANTSKVTIVKQNIYKLNYFNLTNLKYAHALYDIRVSIRSKKAREESMWSNFSSITVRTECRIPDEPPKTNIGSFESIVKQTKRDIFVYWQSLPDWKKNCENFDYEFIAIEEDGVKINVTPVAKSGPYAIFKDMSFKNYKFVIGSVNEIGYSVNKSVVYVPEHNSSNINAISKPKSFTKIAFEKGLYELSWSPPNDHSKIRSYTIFWCNNIKDRPFPCEGILNWTEVSSLNTTFNITVPDSEVYQFAISANTLTESSGMVWAACTVIHNKDISIMKSVGINHIGSTYIEVGWRLDCSDRIGSIKGFYIYYCPIKSPYSNSCKDEVKNIFVDGGDVTMGNVTGLTPYTTYRLSVSLVTTMNSSSIPSEPLFKTTLESAPDTPPMNVRITKVTIDSITIEWYPPKYANGYLQRYEVNYSPQCKPKIVESFMNSTTLYKLDSYTYYNISVVACTVTCSRPSTPIPVQTLVSYPDQMLEPSVKQINETQLSVIWYPPIVRRGKLDYYEFRIKKLKNSLNETTILNLTEQEQLIPGCSGDTNYYFSVRAVNLNNGVAYKGPWSKESEHFCRSSPFFFITLAIIFGICFIVGVFVGAKRLWQRYLIMRDVEVKLPPGLVNPSNEISMTQRSGAGIQKSQNLDPKMRPDSSADEEHLLTKKECLESQDHISTGDSSGCSSGHESVTSSLASGTNYSSTSDSGTEQQSPSESSLRQRKPGSDTLGWDSEIAWPNSKCGYVGMPVDKPTGPSWPTGKSSEYCVLGVDPTHTPQPADTEHGYVPVPVSTTHADTGVKKSSYVTCDSIFNKADPARMISPYVKSGEPALGVMSPSKYVPLKTGEATAAPYVMAGSVLKPKALSDLISIGQGGQAADVSPLPTPTEPTARPDGSSGYVKTDDILGLKRASPAGVVRAADPGDAPEPPPGSYCRLGYSPKAGLLPLEPAKEGPVQAAAPAPTSDYLSHSAVLTKPLDKKSYVPHRPYEAKSLKED